MPIAGSNPTLDTREGFDKITVTEKVTSPYFSDGNTQLNATNIISESLSDDNEVYYFGIAHSSTPTTPEFNVAYGNVDGNGGDDKNNSIISPTKTVYKQWASMLLSPTEVTGTTNSANGRDDDIFILSGRRALMKDRINKKNWTVALSGSTSLRKADAPIGGASVLYLTDDSTDDNPTATPVGDRYNIVAGTDGSVTTPASTTTFGWFYPDIGTMVFSQAELSASIGGVSGSEGDVVTFDSTTHYGFGPVATAQDNNYKTALRFINCLQPEGAYLKFRDEEDQVSNQFFCRIRAGQMNFSNNPTFVSGSLNELRHTSMKGNPTTFIGQVQLFNSAGDIVAVGNLSTPLKKNFSSEATIKVKLTY